MGKYNLLIIEDHALTRFGLKTTFETDANYSQIFEAANAKDGLNILEKKSVDIVIMDLGLPDINGIEATKILREKFPNTKVVILSSHEKEEDVINSIKAGAGAYCTKDVEPEKLLDIVTSVAKGAAWFDPKVARYVLSAAIANGNKETGDIQPPLAEKNEKINLTSREKQVLSLIAEGYSNSEIAKKLEVSINTTKAHVCSILQKLCVNDRTQAAIKAIKNNVI